MSCIRKGIANDQKRLFTYFEKQPLHALFFVADIETYGISGDVFNVWIQEEEDNEIVSVFAQYFDTLIVYTNRDSIDAESIIKYAEENQIAYNAVVARAEICEVFLKLLNFTQVRRNYLCCLEDVSFNSISGIPKELVHKASFGQVEEIIALFKSMPEFTGLDFYDIQIKEHIKRGEISIIEDEDKIVSVAMCSAVTKQHANIGGVCTHKSFRNKGYASAAVSVLAAEMLSKGKKCVLMYNNPKAGAIYLKLGFKESGRTYICIK